MYCCDLLREYPVRYVRIIITAERVIIPQDGFERRPEFHEFVMRLLETVLEASRVRHRLEDLVREHRQTFTDDYFEGGVPYSLSPEARAPSFAAWVHH